MIEFEHVGKTYSNGQYAVKDLNFQVNTGELLALIGPSGCGKTTTMKMINRLVPHSEGRILINGQDISALNPVELRRRIGYVIQQTGLFPHYSIAENIAVVLTLQKCPEPKKQQRVKELLEMVGMDPERFAKRYPHELSGGQQQRVGVARALAADPEIILMDEPFGALDPITREQLQEELIRIQKSMKKTIIFVTHDMDEALKLGDRIGVMKDGAMLQLDTPEKLLKEPAHGFVESFIGKKRFYQNPEYIPVTEIMREHPAYAHMGLSPARAMSLMRQKRTDTLMLVGENGRLEGIVSAYDLQPNLEKISEIGQIIHLNEPVLLETATAKDALIAIKHARFGIIPVITEARQLTGVVTRSSLLTAFADHWAGTAETSAVEGREAI